MGQLEEETRDRRSATENTRSRAKMMIAQCSFSFRACAKYIQVSGYWKKDMTVTVIHSKGERMPRDLANLPKSGGRLYAFC